MCWLSYIFFFDKIPNRNIEIAKKTLKLITYVMYETQRRTELNHIINPISLQCKKILLFYCSPVKCRFFFYFLKHKNQTIQTLLFLSVIWNFVFIFYMVFVHIHLHTNVRFHIYKIYKLYTKSSFSQPLQIFKNIFLVLSSIWRLL